MDLLRILSGITRTAGNREVNLVELRPGQVVRGVLLKMTGEQEGIVSIAGVPVRARLETALSPGEATLLQVQPESKGGDIVLRPLTGSGVPIADRSLADLLGWLGLKNNAQNRLLLDVLHRAGLPLDRDTVQAMAAIAAGRPAGISAEPWLAAAAAARKMDLPLTPETVRALHAVLYGKPPGETLQALRQALADWLRGAEGAARQGMDPAARGAAERLAALLDEAARLIDERLADSPARQAEERGAAERPAAFRPGAGPGGAAGQTMAEGAARQGRTPQTPAAESAWRGGLPAASAGGQGGPAEAGAALARGGTTGESGAPFGRPSADPSGMRADRPAQAAPDHPAAGIVREGQTAGRTAGGTPPGAPLPGDAASRPAGQTADAPQSGPTGQTAPAVHAAREGRAPQAQQASVPAAAGDPASAAPAAGRAEPWLAGLLRALGFAHERGLLEQAVNGQPTGESAAALRETAKGLILTLQQHDAQLPPALKEALQQTLQTITGQQLLLAADRQAPFTVVTLHVPLFPSDGGEQSATVQIHARRRKGEPLDAANCRLLFDLNLARLGPLLMDVQVANRQVGVKVHSDHPAAEALLEAGREEAAAALSALGYRLASLERHPLPERKRSGAESGPDAAVVGPAGGLPGRLGDRPAAKPYKGVDLRI